jgi:hypothetical protein
LDQSKVIAARTAASAGAPLIFEPWQVVIERTLSGPEDIMAFATDHLSNQLSTTAGLAHDLLDWCSAFRQGQDRRIGLFALKISFVCKCSPTVSSLGSIVVAPIALRIWRIDFADGIEEEQQARHAAGWCRQSVAKARHHQIQIKRPLSFNNVVTWAL